MLGKVQFVDGNHGQEGIQVVVERRKEVMEFKLDGQLSYTTVNVCCPDCFPYSNRKYGPWGLWKNKRVIENLTRRVDILQRLVK